MIMEYVSITEMKVTAYNK